MARNVTYLYNPDVESGRVAVGNKSFKVVGHVALVHDDCVDDILRLPGWTYFDRQVELPSEDAFRDEPKSGKKAAADQGASQGQGGE